MFLCLKIHSCHSWKTKNTFWSFSTIQVCMKIQESLNLVLSVQTEGNLKGNKQYKTKSHEFDILVLLARLVHAFLVDSCFLPFFAMIYHHTLSEKTHWYLFHFPVHWLCSQPPFPFIGAQAGGRGGLQPPSYGNNVNFQAKCSRFGQCHLREHTAK